MSNYSPRVQRVALWCGPALIPVFFAGLIAGHWFPFPSAHDSATAIAHKYISHRDGIRLAALCIALAGALSAPFVAVVAAQMKRVEGAFSPLTYLQLGCGMVGSLVIASPAFFMWAAAFRPYRDPVVTQSWNDAAWLALVAPIWPFVFQLLALAAVAFRDRSERPIFPRWLGYLSVWVTVLLIPSALVLWFKTGPFAWQGILTLWLAAVVFTVWLLAVLVVLLRAIRRQEEEPVAPPAVGSEAGRGPGGRSSGHRDDDLALAAPAFDVSEGLSGFVERVRPVDDGTEAS
jgi:hypothetical protein